MTRLALIAVLAIAMAAGARATVDTRSQTQAPKPTPVLSPTACRVYPTSVTETTTDSTGGRTIMTYTASFDPKTFETTQDVTLSSTQGARFNYRQITIYASLEDFIREGSLSPPFPTYRSSTMSSPINMSVQVNYDKDGRWLQTTTSRTGGQQTISNTAWDSKDRPTAGTITGGPAASTFTYVYDDVLRKQTHTVVTGQLRMVQATTFDADANPISRSTQSGSTSSSATIQIHSRATQCLVNSPVAPRPATPSPGIPSSGSVIANISGQSFTSSVGVKGQIADMVQADKSVARIISIGASNQDYTLSLSVTATHGPGTYEVELKMDPDPRKLPRGTAAATLFENRTRGGWAANVAGGSGTITVSSISAGGASGSFSLVLQPTAGTPASGSRSMSGTFNVRF